MSPGRVSQVWRSRFPTFTWGLGTHQMRGGGCGLKGWCSPPPTSAAREGVGSMARWRVGGGFMREYGCSGGHPPAGARLQYDPRRGRRCSPPQWWVWGGGGGGEGLMVERGHLFGPSNLPPRTAHTPEVVGPPGGPIQLWVLKVRPVFFFPESTPLGLQEEGLCQG